MATFWKKFGTNKIVVSATGKPIDCPDCPCDHPLTRTVCCPGVELPRLIPFRIAQTGGTACAVLDGLEGVFEATGLTGDGEIVWYSQDEYTLDAGIYGTTTFKFYIKCVDLGSEQYYKIGTEHVSGSVEYVAEVYLATRCCTPFNAVTNPADFPNASIDPEIECYDATFEISIGESTLYLTISGGTGDCEWVNGTYPLDWPGGNGYNWAYFSEEEGGLQVSFLCIYGLGILGGMSDNPITIGRSCIFQALTYPLYTDGELTLINNYPFRAEGWANVRPNVPYDCDCSGQTLYFVIEQ